mmetsp:Transcript_18273/g.43533  ORF Transcript_18273/g.43533 Transcript_18273/m.43533 type:complete len:220 (+) Transcript_18273:141-800(+)|eukprot:CAMPEP_0177691030 /NCGR_PEP_ID=MMETSP0484_2-20121128/1084_1 /TAXON_ID=354590 /ORGANISM="Rhodomonas lens, Strain RHODO" /LENGTH=219 /DNA_ID=CAMNT_0019201617 /DNA_START=120 /DNA_END=779 /DNA_ORIENTATION=-
MSTIYDFGCRVNCGATTRLKFEAPSSAPFDFKELPHAEHGCFWMADLAKESKGYLQQIQQIDSFWDTHVPHDPKYMQAQEMFYVALVGPKGMQPCVIGQLSCISNTSSAQAPAFQPWMAHLQPTAQVYLCVYRIMPNPAWRSGGALFEKVAKQLVNRWRIAYMSHIDQMMASGAVDQNITFTDTQVGLLLQQLTQHVQGNVEADVSAVSSSVDRITLLD